MEYGLNSIYKTAVFVIIYLLISCFYSFFQTNSFNGTCEEDSFEISIIPTIVNFSPEINIFDAEEESEDQDKVICRLTIEKGEYIDIAFPLQMQTNISLRLNQELLIVTQIDLPPPTLA